MENKFQHYKNKIYSKNTRYFRLMIKIKTEDILKSNSWPIVEAKKILKERKNILIKKEKSFFKLGMVLQDYLILGLLGRLQEQVWLLMH